MLPSRPARAYFNKAAFAGTCTNTAPFGNSGRTLLRGPDRQNVDLSIVKFIPIQERTNLEFRSELFNTFNRVNFANPNNDVLVPRTLAAITSTSTRAACDSVRFEVKLLRSVGRGQSRPAAAFRRRSRTGRLSRLQPGLATPHQTFSLSGLVQKARA